MRLLLRNVVVQIELPSTNDQFYHDLVETINDVHRVFGNNYQITEYLFETRQLNVRGPIGDFIIKITNQGQPEGDEYEGIEEITCDVYYLIRPFKFLKW